jgi:hypothetical protein
MAFIDQGMRLFEWEDLASGIQDTHHCNITDDKGSALSGDQTINRCMEWIEWSKQIDPYLPNSIDVMAVGKPAQRITQTHPAIWGAIDHHFAGLVNGGSQSSAKRRW